MFKTNIRLISLMFRPAALTLEIARLMEVLARLILGQTTASCPLKKKNKKSQDISVGNPECRVGKPVLKRHVP